MFETKLQQAQKSQFSVTIPIALVKMMEWEKGTELVIVMKNNKLQLEKKE